MERRGTVTRWNDDKGFGFIRPDQGGKDLFVHISAVRGEQRPLAGDKVFYLAGKDDNGRLRATHMRRDAGLELDNPAIRRRVKPASKAQKSPPKRPAIVPRRSLFTEQIDQLRFKLSLFLLICAAPIYGSAVFIVERGNLLPALAYVLVSVLTFALYSHDKNSALKGQWRTPESTLHLAEALGGWPGALVAQQLLRHKTRKLSYQLSFWLIVLVHQAFWIDYLLFNQAGLRRLYS